MRAVLTRVKHASVTIDGEVHGQIGEGFLILLGVTHEDTEAQAVKLADKLTGLRIFEDENGKMNRSLEDVKGQLLIVSQFTLYGSCKKGRRPEFLSAARPRWPSPVREVRPALPGQGLPHRDRRVRRLYAGGEPQRRAGDAGGGHRSAVRKEAP